MASASALYQAIALADAPLLAGAMRAQPLPDDVLTLFQVAAGDDGALDRAVAATGARRERVREAAALFVQHVVFSPNADHYRILAVPPDAPQATIREHVGWLMKWIHPDRAANGWESAFAQRVVAAWNDLKTPDRRAEYDRTLPVRPRVRMTPSGKRRALERPARGVPLIALTHRSAPPSSAWSRRLAAYALAAAVAAAVILAPRWFVQAPPANETPAVAAEAGF